MNPLSVCMIGKNEERCLRDTLEALAPFLKKMPKGSELVFLDTGSSDKTREIAREYGARLSAFEWCEDFSAARNHCMGQAANDLVLFLDCDERLTESDPGAFVKAVEAHPEGVGLILRDNHFTERDGKPGIYRDQVPRLFSRKRYHYEGRIHEQVTARPGTAFNAYLLPFLTDHDGYVGSAERMEQKTAHYASLLKAEITEDPENPYLYFQLGQCYNTLFRDEEALSAYEKALDFPLDPDAEYVEMLMNAIGHCLLHLDRIEDAARFVEEHYDAYFHCSDLYCLAGSVRMRKGEIVQAMLEYIKAITAPVHHREGTNSWIPYFNIAVMYEAMGDMENARANYRQCGDYPPALEKLKALGDQKSSP